MTTCIACLALLLVPVLPQQPQQAVIEAAGRFDIDAGRLMTPADNPGEQVDLTFGCGPNGEEFLRALSGVAWTRAPNDDFTAGPDVLQRAGYAAPTNRASGYPDLFFARSRANSPRVGTVFFLRTSVGNLAKVRIAEYQSVDPHPLVCRNLRIEYVVYRTSPQVATLQSASGFDLDTGYSQARGNAPNVTYDLVFSCGPRGEEFLRSMGGATWARSPDNDFTVGTEVLRGATYEAPRHPVSGAADLFFANSRASVPAVGTVFFVRTAQGGLAKVRIAAYETVDPSPQVCRNLRLEYFVY